MRVGVGLWTMQSTVAQPSHHGILYRRFRDDARLVEDLGYDSMWLAEHRFWYDGWCPAPLVAAASAVAATERIRFGTAMALLPQRSPSRFARTVRTLELLSDGRLDVGVGLGHRDAEFDGLGLSRSHRGARMDEGLDALAAGPDHPPLWVGGMAQAAIQRAARVGASFLLPQTLYLNEVDRFVRRIHAAADEAGVPRGQIGILKDAWVAPPGDPGLDHFRTRIDRHYREEVGSWWVLGDELGFAAGTRLSAQLDRVAGTPIVGSPDEAATELLALAGVGVDLVVLRFHFDVTADDFRAPLELTAREVLPRVKEGVA